MGTVDEGTAVMDWMAQEQERGITITSANTTCFWQDCKINIIDTPGHVDFTVEVERSLKVLDGAVVVLCATSGVQPQTETVWRQADRYSVPRILFINKMDRLGASFENVLVQAHDRLGAHAAAIQFPVGAEDDFTGIVDVIREKLITYEDKEGSKRIEQDVPEELKAKVVEYKHVLIEKVSEVDDQLMEKFLEEQEITTEDLVAVGYRKKQLEVYDKLLNDQNYFEFLKEKRIALMRAFGKKYFEKNPWVFGYGLGYLFLSGLDDKKLEQVVQGHSVDSHGKRVDALMKTKA